MQAFLSALCCYSGLMFLVCGLQEDSWKMFVQISLGFGLVPNKVYNYCIQGPKIISSFCLKLVCPYLLPWGEEVMKTSLEFDVKARFFFFLHFCS